MSIRFTFEGKEYEVGMDAYDEDLLIQLPDGRLLRAHWWLEVNPPIPEDLEVVQVAVNSVVKSAEVSKEEEQKVREDRQQRLQEILTNFHYEDGQDGTPFDLAVITAVEALQREFGTWG